MLAAMRLEARALGGRVTRIGMGHARASAAAAALAAHLEPGAPVVLAGISGGLDPDLRPGDIVVASSVRGPDGDECTLAGDDAQVVADMLRERGRCVRVGPIASSKTLVHGARRTALAEQGSLAVDMESSWVADALGSQRLVVVRLVADTAGNFVIGLVRGLAALRGVRPAIEGWHGRAAPTRTEPPEGIDGAR
jgi:4-hydroxy-3-methylbut-2-en-1-yl diphosphate reductase